MPPISGKTVSRHWLTGVKPRRKFPRMLASRTLKRPRAKKSSPTVTTGHVRLQTTGSLGSECFELETYQHLTSRSRDSHLIKARWLDHDIEKQKYHEIFSACSLNFYTFFIFHISILILWVKEQ